MALRSRRGISPVLATLILIVIAVVASLVVYGWIMGWIGAQKRQVAFAVRVIRTNSTAYTVEVRNTGSITVTISKVTVTDPDGDIHEATADKFTGLGTGNTLDPGHSATATTSDANAGEGEDDTEAVGTEVTVTVVTTDKGAFTYKVTVAG